MFLQKIREGAKGWFAWFLVLLIAGVFISWGLSDFLKSTPNTTAATVNGQKITVQSVNLEYERLMRGAEHPETLDAASLKKQALNALVQSSILNQSAMQLGLSVSVAQLKGMIKTIPEFQEKGQFSRNLYLNTLSAAFYTEKTFEEELYRGLLMAQLQQSIIKSEFSLKGELAQLIASADQHRDLGYILIPLASFKKTVTVTPDEISAYYQIHMDLFKSKDEIKVQYILLSLKTDADQEKADQMATLAFENPDTLAVISETLNLKIMTTDWFDQNESHDPIASHPNFQKAAFSNEVMIEKQNSDLLYLGNDQYAVLRLEAFKPSEPLKLYAVKDDINNILLVEKMKQKAQEKAETLAKEFINTKGPLIAKQDKKEWHQLKNTARQTLGDNDEIIQYAFTLPKPQKDKPSFGIVTLNSGDIGIVQVLRAQDGDIDSLSAEQQKLFAQGLAQNFGERTLNLYTHHLLETAKIK